MLAATQVQNGSSDTVTAANAEADDSGDPVPTVKAEDDASVTTADDDARIAFDYVLDSRDEDDEMKTTPKLTLEQQAKLASHLVTHKPYNSACDICIAAKARRRQHRRRLQLVHRSLTKLGEIVTCDHIDLGSWWQHSYKGHMCALIMYDLATGFMGSYPSYTKTGQETL